MNHMTDEEAIDTFLKENDALLRVQNRKALYRKIRRAILYVIATSILLFSGWKLGGFFLTWYNKSSQVAAGVKPKAEEVIDHIGHYQVPPFSSASLESITAEAAKQHAIAQYAYITVQYNAAGDAVGCWITQRKNEIDFSSSTPVAYAYISNYKDYPGWAKTLRFDPKTCIVWNWEGKDP